MTQPAGQPKARLSHPGGGSSVSLVLLMNPANGDKTPEFMGGAKSLLAGKRFVSSKVSSKQERGS